MAEHEQHRAVIGPRSDDSTDRWRLFADVVGTYLLLFMTLSVVLRGEVLRDDAGLSVPTAVLAIAVYVTELRGWDRSKRVRDGLFVVAFVGAITAAVLQATLG